MQTVQITVTPEQAQIWLEKNTRNRPMSMSLANDYASDMKDGLWRETHQGIGFYESGILADGQTRLKAITIANKPLALQVTFGIPEDSGLCIDIHRKRSLSNQLAITGKMPWLGKNETAIALVLMNESKSKQSRSIERIMEFCKPYEAAFIFVKENTSNTVRYVTTAPVKAAILLAYYAEDEGRLKEFCDCIKSGIMKSNADSAAIRLRERLTADGAFMQHTGNGRIEIKLLTMRAIQLFCQRKECARLAIPKEQIYNLKCPAPATTC